MSNSSAQQDYLTGLSQEQIDALTTSSITSIDVSSIPTITWDSSSSAFGSVGTITLNSTGSGYSTSCYTINTGAVGSRCYTSASGGSTFTIDTSSIFGNIEWVNGFPAWGRIEEMCKEYPALKIAFEKFKNTYNLVKDDFDAPPEKRIKP